MGVGSVVLRKVSLSSNGWLGTFSLSHTGLRFSNHPRASTSDMVGLQECVIIPGLTFYFLIRNISEKVNIHMSYYIFLYFYFMYMNALPPCMYMYHVCLVPVKVHRRRQIPWDSSCRWLWTAIWVLGIEPPSSATAASSRYYWANSPLPALHIS